MLHFRRMERPYLGTVSVINPERVASPTLQNPVKPSSLEFWTDVVKAFRAAKPQAVPLYKFLAAYMLFDSESELERNTFASKMIGVRVHSCEQRVGAEFIRRGIWPLQKYLNPPRPGRKKF